MRILCFMIPLFMVGACKSPSHTTVSSENTKTIKSMEKQYDCPKDGTCEVKIYENKSLEFVDDGSGVAYAEKVDGNNLVIEYTYYRKGPEGTADGNYFETVQFEIPTTTKSLKKEGNSLADVNMIFSKFGFRNAAAYQVKKGNLSLQKAGKEISFNLNFKVDGSGQVLNEVAAKAILD